MKHFKSFKKSISKSIILVSILLVSPVSVLAEDVTINGIEYSVHNDKTVWVIGADKELTSCIIPSTIKYGGSKFTITAVSNQAFSYCTSLVSVTIPNSVTYIGDYAFSFCTSLTNLTLPNSVTYIGNYAISYCTSLTNVTIPKSVRYIGDYAFSFCTSLTKLVLPNSVTYIGDHAFTGCTSLPNVPGRVARYSVEVRYSK